MNREILEQIEDDVQLRIDNFFDKITAIVSKEARSFRENELRRVFVDHPHIDPDVIHEMYARLLKESMQPEALDFYVKKWAKHLEA